MAESCLRGQSELSLAGGQIALAQRGLACQRVTNQQSWRSSRVVSIFPTLLPLSPLSIVQVSHHVVSAVSHLLQAQHGSHPGVPAPRVPL